MDSDLRQRLCEQLSDILDALDSQQATIAAIHVSHAMDALRCPLRNGVDDRGGAAE